MLIVTSYQLQIILTTNLERKILEQRWISKSLRFIERGCNSVFKVFDSGVFKDLKVILMHRLVETAFQWALRQGLEFKKARLAVVFLFGVNSSVLIVYFETLVRKIVDVFQELLVFKRHQ